MTAFPCVFGGGFSAGDAENQGQWSVAVTKKMIYIQHNKDERDERLMGLLQEEMKKVCSCYSATEVKHNQLRGSRDVMKNTSPRRCMTLLAPAGTRVQPGPDRDPVMHLLPDLVDQVDDPP